MMQSNKCITQGKMFLPAGSSLNSFTVDVSLHIIASLYFTKIFTESENSEYPQNSEPIQASKMEHFANFTC